MITHHHDGHGLNDSIDITCDERDPDAGGASHGYAMEMPDPDGGGPLVVGSVSFQHGPRDEPGSTPGVTDAALLAIVLDRYEGFQAGPYACRQNERVIAALTDALSWMRVRANDRANRGVLGKNAK